MADHADFPLDTASTWFAPQWPYADQVAALTTSRVGEFSQPPYAGFNLAEHVGDSAASVQANRRRLLQHCADRGLNEIQWLEQVHGTRVLKADAATVLAVSTADAAWTSSPGLGLAVMTADCLPVVVIARDGSRIGVAHGGWRGLVAGVLARLLTGLGPEQSGYAAWIGPAISAAAYEVGAEVATQVTQAVSRSGIPADSVLQTHRRPGKYQLDLIELARRQLLAAGVAEVYPSDVCSFASERCYSYRRDGITGRMVTLVWIPAVNGA